MKLGPALLLARRALSGRRRENGRPGRRYLRGAMAGVALSLVPLVVVLVVSDGMIQGITARYIETGTYHLQATPFFAGSATALERSAASLRSSMDIRAAFPEMEGPAVVLEGGKTAGALLRAVDPGFLTDPGTAAYLRLVDGVLQLRGANDILLGESLAKTLHARVGDLVTLVTAREMPEGEAQRFSPKVAPFRVRGIVSAGYRELDALWAFVGLGAGERMLSPGSSRIFIGIKVARPFKDLAAPIASVETLLGPEWSVSGWPQIEVNLFKSFQTTRALLLLVMAVAVAVAAINVGSALIMLVLERRRDIAILKSAGASSPSIGMVFLLAGLATGAAGTVIGLGIGMALSWRVNDLIAGIEALVNGLDRLGAWLAGEPMPPHLRLLDPAYYLERIPVHFHVPELLAVALVSLFVCALASLLPARRAARLPPLEIFRKT